MNLRLSARGLYGRSTALRRLVARVRPWRSWARLSSSQHGEDLILASLLPERTGHYVDVGASHPVKFNNTWALYRRGWSGTLIDPLDESEMLCRIRRPRDRFLKLAIGRRTGSATLHTFTFDMASTLSAGMADAATDFGLSGRREQHVAVVPLSSLGFVASPLDPSLLDVDVEDLDLEVLESNDFSTFCPRVIIVEERRQPIEAETEISLFLASQGYVLCAVTIHNSIYAHGEWLTTNSAFRGYFPPAG